MAEARRVAEAGGSRQGRQGREGNGIKDDEMARVVVGWAFGLYKELDDQGTDQRSPEAIELSPLASAG